MENTNDLYDILLYNINMHGLLLVLRKRFDLTNGGE